MAVDRSSPREPRVWVALEDDSVADRICAALEDSGIEASRDTAGGRRGSPRPSPADLVVLDTAGLPGACGLEEPSHPGVGTRTGRPAMLLLTEDDSDESLARARKSGADDLLTKTSNPSLVVHRVRSMLAHGRALRDLEQAQRAKLDFLANVSHELRTPVTAILGFADVVDPQAGSRTSASEGAAAVLGIQRNAANLIALFDDLLEVVALGSGDTPLVLGECSPAEIGARATEALRPAAEAKGLDLRIRSEGSPAALIRTDAHRLQQLISHLLSNAVKFTDEGLVELVVRRASNPGEVEIMVSDSGVGFTQEQMAHLWQPLTQLDESMARRHGGLGLGLSLVKQLSELLGADVSVATEHGSGSTFSVRVPSLDPEMSRPVITPTEDARPESPVRPTARSIRRTTRGESKSSRPVDRPRSPPGRKRATSIESYRVLLVEDAPDNQWLMRRMIELSGSTVTIAANGRIGVDTALASLDADPFDVILMDMQMPVLDGYGATAELRERGWERPIIAATAHSGRDNRERCLEAGCDDFLAKPIRRDLLLSTVVEWARKARLSFAEPDKGGRR